MPGGPESVILAAGTIFQGDASTNLGRPLGQTDLHLFHLPDEAVADQFDSPRKLPVERCCEPVWKIAFRLATSRYNAWLSAKKWVTGFSQ